MNLRELGRRRVRQITALLTAAGVLGAVATGVAVWSPGTSTADTGSTSSTPSSTPDDQSGGASTDIGSPNSLLPDNGSPSVARSGGS